MAITKLVADSLGTGVGGKVLQVVQVVKSDTFSSSSATLVDITGLSASITPSSSSNKILVMVSLSIGGNDSGLRLMTKLFRNSTVRTSVEYSKTAKAYIKTTANGTSKTITYLSGYKAGNSTTYSGGMQTFRGKILGKRVTITRKDPMKRSYR